MSHTFTVCDVVSKQSISAQLVLLRSVIVVVCVLGSHTLHTHATCCCETLHSHADSKSAFLHIEYCELGQTDVTIDAPTALR
eukprot:17874-Heterococcus_DN1.PRE.1